MVGLFPSCIPAYKFHYGPLQGCKNPSHILKDTKPAARGYNIHCIEQELKSKGQGSM